jgi:OOP family OmpA-OmpF porin
MKVALAGCALMAASAASATVPDNYFFLEGSVVAHDERIADQKTTFGGRVGFGGVFDRSGGTTTGVELGIFHNPFNTTGSSGDSQGGVMLDLMQSYTMSGWNPYVFAGLGLVGENIGSSGGIYPAIEAGGGLLFGLTPDLAGRASLSVMSVRNDEVNPGTDAYVDFRFNVGLLFAFGDAPAAPAATPAPAARATDSDGDGLADNKDACPSTPASTADGCPAAAPVVQTDSDGDGVYDAQDDCSGTLAGLKVDAKGCAVETVDGQAQSIVLKGVTFLPGSATLTAEAKVVLETATAALSGQKSLKVELGGHTDSQGKDAANQALSQRRADAVRQFLIDKGIEGDRLTAVGYGETQPIADNNTAPGRAENRRVEFKIQ